MLLIIIHEILLLLRVHIEASLGAFSVGYHQLTVYGFCIDFELFLILQNICIDPGKHRFSQGYKSVYPFKVRGIAR